MTKFPMTVEGAEALRAELDRLKKEKPLVSQAIAEAREHGDLKENAEYHAAREQMGFLEGRIQDIEARLSNAQIIDIRSIPPGDKVIFGVTVTIINCDTEKKVTYKIVGEYEADVASGKISLTSPIARALIGKEVGDVVLVKTPAGEVEYEIEMVQHI
ncbi:MAG TPA: transcription elongation factor GreA [Pseudomonadales bacterium]|nr:transcription elongation factor GreA [Pseudomonadales bacterium]HRG49922.1 transcription elongation factor GreA [Pseudomonadales bacterium]